MKLAVVNDSSQEIIFEPIEHLNDCGVEIVNDLDEDKYLVVNTRNEMEKYLNMEEISDNEQCAGLMEELDIDFEKHTFLIGKQRLTGIEGSLIYQEIEKLGEEGYIYRVRIKNGGYTAIGQFRFGIIIPKISTSAHVEFDVEVI